MQLPDPKQLKALADACRKAGISHFKCGEFEFTLGNQPLDSKGKAKKPKQSTFDPADFTTDSLTEEQLLMWSAGTPLDRLSNE